MNERPETRYAWNGDVSLAYQVVGQGPVDVLLVPGWFSNLDLQRESPYLARFLQRLSEQARVIITDRRGWGLSERFSPSDVPPLEALADDLGVVLDAAGSERAVVASADDTGLIAQFFAAAHPERVAGLILINSYVSYRATEETPWMPDNTWWEEFSQKIAETWGRSWEGGPDVGGAAERDWFLRMQRSKAIGVDAQSSPMPAVKGASSSEPTTSTRLSFASIAANGSVTMFLAFFSTMVMDRSSS